MKKKLLSLFVLLSIIFLGINLVSCKPSETIVSTGSAYRVAIGVSPSATVSESQNLNYSLAYNVNARISATYNIANCQPVELLTQSGDRQIMITAGEGANLLANNFVNPQGIELTYINNYFVINVSFTNDSVSNDMLVKPEVNFNAITNFNTFYSVDDGEYESVLQDNIVVGPAKTKVCHVKFAIADLSNPAEMNLDTAINYELGRA